METEPHGPLASGADRSVALSGQRLRIYNQLSPDSWRAIGEIATAVALSPNRTREHLNALVRFGLAERTTRPTKTAKGRPAWWYRRRRASHTFGIEGLALAMLEQISRTPKTSSRLVKSIATELAGTETHTDESSVTETSAETTLSVAMEKDGYSPILIAPGTLLLRACPVLQLATEYPEIVCGIHEVLASAIAARSGEIVRVRPFADSRGCLVEILGDPS